jgi:hypothetical protein
LKHEIQERFRNNVHFAWCSERFDSKTADRYSVSASVPPSSNPADIYRVLKAAVEANDQHCWKINEQRIKFQELADDWLRRGEIDQAAWEDILWTVQQPDFSKWRPVVYLIPRAPVQDRLVRVRASLCAGTGPEYTIADLRPSEFDMIEI